MTLDKLFIKYGSDKSSLHHSYSSVYKELLEPLREKHISLLELGVGGYHFPDRGGGCLKAFRDYLPNATIWAIDKFEKTHLDMEKRIRVFKLSQDDEVGLKELCNEAIPSIILDDASHQCPLTIKSFEILFPLLQPSGLYIIEDTHSSYWDEIATDGTNFGGGNHPDTTMNYFKALCDHNLNSEECKGRIPFRDIEAEKFPIQSIQFYNKMIIIKKK
jgi:hypothetical protein